MTSFLAKLLIPFAFIGGIFSHGQTQGGVFYDGPSAPQEQVTLGVASSFPTSIYSVADINPTDPVSSPSHSARHNQASAEIGALETKAGTGASTPTANTVYVGNGVGTSAYSATPTITGLTTTNILATGSSTLQNFTALQATSTSATSTNFFATTASSTSLFSANFSLGIGSLGTTQGLNVITGGAVGIASTTPFSKVGVGSGTASSSVTVAEYKYGAGSNVATSTSSNIDCRSANQIAWPHGTSATTLTLVGLTPGQGCRIVVQNPNSGTAGAITWAVQSGAVLMWAGGVAPTLSTTAKGANIVSFAISMGSSTMMVIGAGTTGAQ